MGTGQLPVGRSFRQARFGGKTIECPLVGSKGDTLMVNHGFIASANVFKVNIWVGSSELMGPLDLSKRLHSCQKYASVTSVFCMYYALLLLFLLNECTLLKLYHLKFHC